jgi:hypothetical protein
LNEIDTVDGFQVLHFLKLDFKGMERDLIIFSSVRSNKEVIFNLDITQIGEIRISKRP